MAGPDDGAPNGLDVKGCAANGLEKVDVVDVLPNGFAFEAKGFEDGGVAANVSMLSCIVPESIVSSGEATKPVLAVLPTCTLPRPLKLFAPLTLPATAPLPRPPNVCCPFCSRFAAFASRSDWKASPESARIVFRIGFFSSNFTKRF